MNSYLYPDFFLMNLLKLIQKGESETVEFKQNFDKEAIISTGAMANRKGGIVLVTSNLAQNKFLTFIYSL